MFEWKYVLFTVCFVGLSLMGIPIYYEEPMTKEETSFRLFMKQFNKSYEDEDEYRDRLEKFKVSLTMIEELNKKSGCAECAVYGVTQFADLTSTEFEERHLVRGLMDRRPGRTHHHRPHRPRHHRSLPEDIPSKFDWRGAGVVTPVKDQKLCGACWAFSVVETIESMAAIRHGNLDLLSIQQVIDCAGNGNMGCDGGDTCSLVDWLDTNKIKVAKESSYPLLLETAVCKVKKPAEGVQVAHNHTCEILIGKEEKLLRKLKEQGPLAVAVNALPWQFYLGGIIQFNCDSGVESINHAVQLVGYDISGPTPHYLVRNSWGTFWGLKGYAKLAVGNNICGVATRVAALDVL